HKRNVEEFPYLNNISALQDITEINGFDNLHCAKGVLKTSMERASKLWGSVSCRYLASGSTVGVLSAIFATTHRGDKVLIARNCHKSVYNAVELLGLKPIYIMPQKVEGYDIYGSISVKSVEDAFRQNSDIKLVVLTSPTYEGVISDIAKIARVVHSNNAILFVDEAHGAHLDLSPYFTGGAVRAGADLVVQSLHKTLPSLTQTAILHICTNAVNEVDVDRALAIFETSSPSYILLSSIDGAVKWLEGCANKKFEMYHNRLIKLYKQLDELSILRIFNDFDKNCQSVFLIDMSKINIFTNGAISGVELQNWLRNKYNIELEMATCTSALAMTSVGDSDLNLQSLACALKDIDSQLASKKNSKNSTVKDQSYKQNDSPNDSPNDSVKSQS
ncbi:MAG: aminotransferase class I/II-fold pyridoxal phosphate-dependent enzyme, partial [Clostridia bacterium]